MKKMGKEKTDKNLRPLLPPIKLPEKIYIIAKPDGKEEQLELDKVTTILGKHRGVSDVTWGENIWATREFEKVYLSRSKSENSNSAVENYFNNLNNLYNNFVLQKTAECGFGVNAREPIAANSLVVLYLGELGFYKVDEEGKVAYTEKNPQLAEDGYVCQIHTKEVLRRQRPYISGKKYTNFASLLLCAPDEEKLKDSFLNAEEIKQIQSANLRPFDYSHRGLDFIGLKAKCPIKPGEPLVWDYSNNGEFFETIASKFYLLNKQGNLFSKTNALLYLNKKQKIQDIKAAIAEFRKEDVKDIDKAIDKIAYLLLTSHHRILLELSENERNFLERNKLLFYKWFKAVFEKYEERKGDNFKLYLFEGQCALYTLLPHLKIERNYQLAKKEKIPEQNVQFFETSKPISLRLLRLEEENRESLKKLDEEAIALYTETVNKKITLDIGNALKVEMLESFRSFIFYWQTRFESKEKGIVAKSYWFMGLAYCESSHFKEGLKCLEDCKKDQQLIQISQAATQTAQWKSLPHIDAKIMEYQVVQTYTYVIHERESRDKKRIKHLENRMSEYMSLGKEACKHWDKFSDMGLKVLCQFCFYMADFTLDNLEQKFFFLERCKLFVNVLIKSERLKLFELQNKKMTKDILAQFWLITLLDPAVKANNSEGLKLRCSEKCYEMMNDLEIEAFEVRPIPIAATITITKKEVIKCIQSITGEEEPNATYCSVM